LPENRNLQKLCKDSPQSHGNFFGGLFVDYSGGFGIKYIVILIAILWVA
jgi:hypothetical protein